MVELTMDLLGGIADSDSFERIAAIASLKDAEKHFDALIKELRADNPDLALALDSTHRYTALDYMFGDIVLGLAAKDAMAKGFSEDPEKIFADFYNDVNLASKMYPYVKGGKDV